MKLTRRTIAGTWRLAHSLRHPDLRLNLTRRTIAGKRLWIRRRLDVTTWTWEIVPVSPFVTRASDRQAERLQAPAVTP